MFISSFEVFNYKSFSISQRPLSLQPGFNLIVGQNDVGKTALVEALSLRFKNNPHRSIKTSPEFGLVNNSISKCEVSFDINKSEAMKALSQLGSFFIPIGDSNTFGFSFTSNFSEGDFNDEQYKKFMQFVQNGGRLRAVFEGGEAVSGYLEHYGDPNKAKHFYQVAFNKEKNTFVPGNLLPESHRDIQASKPYGSHLAQLLTSKIYTFKAERLNIDSHSMGNNSVLEPDCINLAEVLHLLQNSNPHRFKRFNDYVTRVFPHIKQIATPPIGGNQVQISIWTHDVSLERPDLMVKLSESGTGIGQVLAILYVVVNSDLPRIIIIDEPQSFLHPGAIRKLIEILKLHSQHQFIITTHSPTVIAAANPQAIFLVRREEFQSLIDEIDVSKTKQLQQFLEEIGARLSDVFGSDNILWVEGSTEEKCFPIIVEKTLKQPLAGTQIMGVVKTGDFDGKHSKTVLGIYERLSGGQGLLPPAIGFIFDRETRKPQEIKELEHNSEGKVSFLKRRMYENYLLNVHAIAHVLSNADLLEGQPVTSDEVKQWLQTNGLNRRFFKQGESPSALNTSEWFEKVDGAKVLEDLFADLSETRVSYKNNKVMYGLALTEWIVDNSPSDLNEVAELIQKKLQSAKI